MTHAPAPRVPGDVLVHLRRARDHIDRHYAEPVDLDTLAGIAGLSKYHFLLRATNLTVTEVCFAVGFASLGSFSSRFGSVTGETPREFQQRYAASGAPRIPGCYVFMWGLAERRPERPTGEPAGSAIQEKPAPPSRH